MDDFSSTEEVITFCFTDSSIRSNAKGLILEKLHTLELIFWPLNHYQQTSKEVQYKVNEIRPLLYNPLHTSVAILFHLLTCFVEKEEVALATDFEIIAQILKLKFSLKMAL